MKTQLLLLACLGISMLSFGQDIGKIGVNRFIHAVGTQNTSVGLSAGASLTPGTSVTANTFVGYSAGFSNTGGYENSFFGSSAGFSNTSGKDNTFNGYLSGYSNTSGTANAFIGSQAGYKNTSGFYGTFIGPNAGYSNTTGTQNTFVGLSAGYFSLTGGNNTFIGAGAGENNNSGGDNVFLGFRSGYANTSGVGNIALGSNSGGGNGQYNVAIGQYSGGGGTKNIYLGYQAQAIGPNATSLSNAVAIGTNARVSINNAIVLGDTTNANIGIGTTRPANRMEIRSFDTNASGLRFTNLTSNSPTVSNPGKVLSVSNSGDVILVPGGTASTHSDSVWVRNSANTYYSGNGNVGIGTNAPAYKLDVNGDINFAPSRDFRVGGYPLIKGVPYDVAANLIIGYDAGSLGAQNVILGTGAGSGSSTGSGNVFIGWLAGDANQNGSSNTFVGLSSGRSNTSGLNNVFMGNGTGGSNTTGFDNTFLGRDAGHSNLTGYYNIFVGTSAGSANQGGRQNTFLGYQAGVSSTAIANTFVGYRAGADNTTGQNNTFIGFQAGTSNTTGNNNIIIGPTSNTNPITGNDNILMGYNSGAGDGSGIHNIIIGGESGRGNWSGGSNTLIGYRANAKSHNLENATAIGADARVTISNAVVLGANANVGIGTSAPLAKLHIVSEKSNESGVRLENLTTNSPSVVNTSSFLTVNQWGDVVLGTQSAKSLWLQTASIKQWPDYVFAKRHPPLALDKLNQYIQINQHLPGFPSAKEMTVKGASVETLIINMVKTQEEQAQYLIQLKTENNQLRKDNQEIKELLKQLLERENK